MSKGAHMKTCRSGADRIEEPGLDIRALGIWIPGSPLCGAPE